MRVPQADHTCPCRDLSASRRLPTHRLTITGVVKDTSGAVLPGVTVEASSPALIEKARSVVTDGTGQYRIVDLVPACTRSRSR